jgi:hypothetical protein
LSGGGFGDSNFGFELAFKGQKPAFLGSIWLYLGSIWVRFFTIVNNNGQSLGSFFQKNFFGKIIPETLADQPLSRRVAETENGLIACNAEP